MAAHSQEQPATTTTRITSSKQAPAEEEEGGLSQEEGIEVVSPQSLVKIVSMTANSR